jgi:hypothetical protein
MFLLLCQDTIHRASSSVLTLFRVQQHGGLAAFTRYVVKFALRNGDTQPEATVKISASIETGLPIANKIAGLVNATKMNAVEEFRQGVERASQPLFVMELAFEIIHIRQASFVFSCTQTSILFLLCVYTCCACARAHLFSSSCPDLCFRQGTL